MKLFLNKIQFYFLLGLFIGLASCKKSDFLDTNPDNSKIVPSTLEDCQQLLDNDRKMNGTNPGAGLIPSLGITGTDDYYVLDQHLSNNITPGDNSKYVWADDPYLGTGSADWALPYIVVFYSNQVLDLLDKIEMTSQNKQQYQNVKGQALFHRSLMFYSLAQIFAPHYDQTTASTDWGIPLRLSSDINEPISRPTVQQTYDRVFGDLKEAASLLPEIAPFKTRPTKIATYALLARIYQTIGNYDSSLHYASKSLSLDNQLLDFNTDFVITPNSPSVPLFNKEVLFHALIGYSQLIGFANVDSTIRISYENDDLRKTVNVYNASSGGIFFFIGSYNKTYAPFAGIANDEVYLIRAECNARKGNVTEALQDLNTLLRKRYKTGMYTDFVTTDQTIVLNKILEERRKELLFRGLRWTDLRRLNKEGVNTTLKRFVNGQSYTLISGSNKWTWPIPPDIISFNPDMPQNSR